MGVYDEPLQDIKTNLLEQWDFSGIFPVAGYTNPKQPLFVSANNWQLLEQLETLTNGGQAPQPIITIGALPARDEHRTFSDVYQTGVGTGPLHMRLGTRVKWTCLIGCWADEQLGGLSFARKLAGQVHGAVFYYRNRLTTIRHLEVLHSQEGEHGTAQFWHVDLAVSGDVLMTVDV